MIDDQSPLCNYPIVVPIVVRFRDIDAMGHVNNAVYLTYFEIARVAYHQALAGGAPLGATDFDFILAEVTCRYRSPVILGETVLVGIRVGSLGRKSFTFEYEMREQASGRLVADGQSAQVMYDYGQRCSRPLSGEFLAKVEALQGPLAPRDNE
jgi:acyl-CoA thioester hydrolase